MKDVFKIGSTKAFKVLVEPKDTATFINGEVHPVYATFALGRDAEWCGRLFVLEMKEDDEEGIGTFLNIEHKSPALLGQQVNFISELIEINGNEVICKFTAFVGSRIIAIGTQGQKILKKEKIERIFASLNP